MKQVMLLVAALALTVGTLSAQEKERPQQGQMDPAAMVEKLTESLSLSDDQAEKITAIYTAEFEARENSSSDERPSREEMEKAREEMSAKVMAVLTEEQQEAYTKLQESQTKSNSQGGRQGGGGRRQ